MKKFLASIAIPVVMAASPALAASPELTRVVVGDSVCRLEWKPVEEANGYNIYLRLQDGRYSKLNRGPVHNNHVRLNDLINGRPYRFGVTAVLSEGESAVAETGMVVPVGYGHTRLNLKGGDKAADYHLISVPYQTKQMRPEDIFGYFPEYRTNLWRLFSLERDGYREYGDIGRMDPGKGFWFLSRDDAELFLYGRTANVYEPFKVTLHPGWNIIGSPFLFPVDWEEVINANGEGMGRISNEAWGFDNGGFVRNSAMEPFKGYFVFNGYAEDVELIIPPVPQRPEVVTEEARREANGRMASAAMVAAPGDDGWLYRISARTENYSDGDNLLGVDPSTAENPAQAAEPPAWPQHLSLYFVRPEEAGIRRSDDVRTSSAADEWLIFVEGGESPQVILEWENVKGSQPLELHDPLTGASIDMSGRSSYSFSRNNASPRKIVIRRAEKSFLR